MFANLPRIKSLREKEDAAPNCGVPHFLLPVTANVVEVPGPQRLLSDRAQHLHPVHLRCVSLTKEEKGLGAQEVESIPDVEKSRTDMREVKKPEAVLSLRSCRLPDGRCLLGVDHVALEECPRSLRGEKSAR
jgi:hypothetical protein